MPIRKIRPKSKPIKLLDRRQALKGMGVIAVGAPTLIACSTTAVSSGGTGGQVGTGGLGTGGTPGTGGLIGTGGNIGTGGIGGGHGIAGADGTGGTAIATGGVGAGGAAGKAGGTGGASAPVDAGVDGGLASMFDKAATCTLTPTDPAGEGPFFVHDGEGSNEELIRSDMRDQQAGVELQLNLRLLDQTMGCNAPIKGAQVYVWHTNAIGYYSGFNNQNPDVAYTGGAERTPDNSDRFCRGIQISDDQGIVSFRTIFPGWYDGRAIHIHFVALRPGSDASILTTDPMSYRSTQYMIFTTQMYFDESYSRNIHENYSPYNSRASGANYDKYVKPETNVRPTSHMNGDVAVGFLNIITASTGSRR